MNQLVSLGSGGQLADLGLLTHLDLHTNHLSTISEDIGYLKNLQVQYFLIFFSFTSNFNFVTSYTNSTFCGKRVHKYYKIKKDGTVS